MLKLMLLLAYWIYFTYMKLKSKKSLIFYVNEISKPELVIMLIAVGLSVSVVVEFLF